MSAFDILRTGIVCLFLGFTAQAEEVVFALVHGRKAAFNMATAEGWVIDNEAGAESGLPCVLFPKGQKWDSADPLMYAKIASPEFTEAEAFAKKAIVESKAERGEFAVKRVEEGKTKGGQAYFINEYAANAEYPRTERVAYVQLVGAVAYIVYSGDRPEAFLKEEGALKTVVESITALEVKKEEK